MGYVRSMEMHARHGDRQKPTWQFLSNPKHYHFIYIQSLAAAVLQPSHRCTGQAGLPGLPSHGPTTDGKPSPSGCHGEDAPNHGAVSTQFDTIVSRGRLWPTAGGCLCGDRLPSRCCNVRPCSECRPNPGEVARNAANITIRQLELSQAGLWTGGCLGGAGLCGHYAVMSARAPRAARTPAR